MKAIYKTTLLSLFSVFLAQPAIAASDSQQFNVKIKILAACDIKTKSPTDVNFGEVSSLAKGNQNSDGSLFVTCTRGTAYNIALDNGANGANINERKMKGMGENANTISYQLFRNADRSPGSIWGNTSSTEGNAGNVLTQTGTGAEQEIKVYGQVNEGATNVPAGDYQDTVTATINY